jgi:hypothetical protein
VITRGGVRFRLARENPLVLSRLCVTSHPKHPTQLVVSFSLLICPTLKRQKGPIEDAKSGEAEAHFEAGANRMQSLKGI